MDFIPFTVNLSPWHAGPFALAIQGGVVLLVIGAILYLTSRLGERRRSVEKDRPYECGIIPDPRGRMPIPVPFYLVALFFLIFDVEGAYILSWAIAFRELGWTGWLEMTLFIAILLLSLIYLWAKGGLDWGTGGER